MVEKTRTTAASVCMLGNDNSVSNDKDTNGKEMITSKLTEFNDPVHGPIELDEVCLAIVDSPQFQRLRYVRQLAMLYLVYPSALHTRFEHCVGTCFLARKVIRRIRKLQPEIGVTDVEERCVEIAALCHDLGHGPFSHSFENFIEQANGTSCKWKHEAASLAMFDHIYNTNPLVQKAFQRAGIAAEDREFIKSLIYGRDDGLRPPAKHFLYNIVANKDDNVDVDKFDYLIRDSFFCGLPTGFDHRRIIKNVRVLSIGERTRIGFRDKVATDISDMFHFRDQMHRRAYKHKTVKIFEHMVTEMLLKANNWLTFRGCNGQLIKLSETIHDMTAYSQLRDSIVDAIRWSESMFLPDAQNALEPARTLLAEIENRQQYRHIGEAMTRNDDEDGDLAAHLLKAGREVYADMKDDDILAIPVSFDWGKQEGANGTANPVVDDICFYVKEHPDKALRFAEVFRQKAECSMPQKCCERMANFYLKVRNNQLLKETVFNAFKEWCGANKIRAKERSIQFTPMHDNSLASLQASFGGAIRLAGCPRVPLKRHITPPSANFLITTIDEEVRVKRNLTIEKAESTNVVPNQQ